MLYGARKISSLCQYSIQSQLIEIQNRTRQLHKEFRQKKLYKVNLQKQRLGLQVPYQVQDQYRSEFRQQEREKRRGPANESGGIGADSNLK